MKRATNMRQMIKTIVPGLSALILCLMPAVVSQGQTNKEQTQEIVASGGTFTLQKSVVAGGGSPKQQLPVSENGTTGQAVAGSASSGGQFKIYSGFWTADDFAPTAATATITGRIKTADGRGIKNVSVVITYQNGAMQSAISSSFGYFSFAELPVGETYVVSVSAKRFTFSQSAQMISLVGDISDVEFIADAAESTMVAEQP